ncbi:MAG: dynamin family protein [Desulfobulbaceae bacterium]|nr:dynamin family protein [Desulfobulbaceae bacterium]
MSESAKTPENASYTSLVNELEILLRKKIRGHFIRYQHDFDSLLTPLRGKPIVLLIGNYSSGKSTFINELLGHQVQRTGQSPTDDSFTILTGSSSGHDEAAVPGTAVIRDESLPFAGLEKFGERLLAHLFLRPVASPLLEKMTLIDTPGMLDSVTERDRGYNYLGVVGKLASLADIIILMFDPLKAGTIKETYQAIRGTLPGATSEDRIIYVMNRIDECDSPADLVRAYGTLCWNLSQMTGRKDIPRIFLTYSPAEVGEGNTTFKVWDNEREDLVAAVRQAPARRLNHILQDVDREVRGLRLEVEALAGFKQGFGRRLKMVLRNGLAAMLGVGLFGDSLLKALAGYPETPLFSALLQGRLDLDAFWLPTAAAATVLMLTLLYVRHLLFPGYTKAMLKNPDQLVLLDSDYKNDIWSRVRDRVVAKISDQPRQQLMRAHRLHLKRLDDFLDQDLRRYYQREQG